MPTCTSMFSNTSFELSTCFPHVAVREQIDSDDEENASFESIVSDNSDPEYEPDITGEISSEDNSDDDGEAVKKKKNIQVSAESYTRNKNGLVWLSADPPSSRTSKAEILARGKLKKLRLKL